MKTRYSTAFKRRVAVAVHTGASPQILAARLKISPAEVQKWAKEYAVDPKKLTWSQREVNALVSALLQKSATKRYPSDFRGRVATVVRSGPSATAVASKLGLSTDIVQKWSKEYASERQKLPRAQAEKELASLHGELASMERQVQERLVEAFLDPSGASGSGSGSCTLGSFSSISPGACNDVPVLPATVPPQMKIYSPFTMAATFTPPGCSSCEYRQYVCGTFLYRATSADPWLPLTVLGYGGAPIPASAPGIEDGCDGGMYCYGHRDQDRHCDDNYLPSPRTQGCSYTGHDHPQIIVQKGYLYTMALVFTGYIVDTSQPIADPPFFKVVSMQTWNVNCSGTA